MVILPGFRTRVSKIGPMTWLASTETDFEVYSPYFGQAGWFMYYHEEKIPSAIERYQKEILRVFGVLESVLSKQEWLVGGKCTIADLSFIPYASMHSLHWAWPMTP